MSTGVILISEPTWDRVAKSVKVLDAVRMLLDAEPAITSYWVVGQAALFELVNSPIVKYVVVKDISTS